MAAKNNLLEWQRYQEIRPFFDQLLASDDLSTPHMSSFWRKNLEQRRNFPTYNEIVTFRRGLASAIGYSFKINEDVERQAFLRMFGRARALAPLQYLQENRESNVGHPYQFYEDGILSSSAGIDNAANAYRIETALQQYHVAPSEHRILEIGAGYGGVAEVLIRRLNPAVYLICDLPHNLFLSAFYLGVIFPARKLHFVNNEAPETISDSALIFATPEGLERIRERFTLVVNTFSFQEMPLAEIRRYFRFIHDHLADSGLFYFFNHHRVAEGAQKPGDYPFEQFAVRRWGPMPCPQHYLFGARQAYEVVMQPNTGERLPSYFDSVTQTLALLMFMAVDRNLMDTCDRLVKGEISDEVLTYLAALREVLSSRQVSGAQAKLSQLHSPAEWEPVTAYVAGLLDFFRNDMRNAAENFSRALELGLAGFARTRALVFLALTTPSSEQRRAYIHQAIETTPQFQSDLEAGDISLEQFKLAYQYAFPGLRLQRRLVPRRLRRALAGVAKRTLP